MARFVVLQHQRARHPIGVTAAILLVVVPQVVEAHNPRSLQEETTSLVVLPTLPPPGTGAIIPAATTATPGALTSPDTMEAPIAVVASTATPEASSMAPPVVVASTAPPPPSSTVPVSTSPPTAASQTLARFNLVISNLDFAKINMEEQSTLAKFYATVISDTLGINPTAVRNMSDFPERVSLSPQATPNIFRRRLGAPATSMDCYYETDPASFEDSKSKLSGGPFFDSMTTYTESGLGQNKSAIIGTLSYVSNVADVAVHTTWTTSTGTTVAPVGTTSVMITGPTNAPEAAVWTTIPMTTTTTTEAEGSSFPWWAWLLLLFLLCCCCAALLFLLRKQLFKTKRGPSGKKTRAIKEEPAPLKPEVEDLFSKIDTDGDGVLSREELDAALSPAPPPRYTLQPPQLVVQQPQAMPMGTPIVRTTAMPAATYTAVPAAQPVVMAPQRMVLRR